MKNYYYKLLFLFVISNFISLLGGYFNDNDPLRFVFGVIYFILLWYYIKVLDDFIDLFKHFFKR